MWAEMLNCEGTIDWFMTPIQLSAICFFNWLVGEMYSEYRQDGAWSRYKINIFIVGKMLFDESKELFIETEPRRERELKWESSREGRQLSFTDGVNVMSLSSTGITEGLSEPFWSTTSPNISRMRMSNVGWKNCMNTLTPILWSCWWVTRLTWSQWGLYQRMRPETLQVQRDVKDQQHEYERK